MAPTSTSSLSAWSSSFSLQKNGLPVLTFCPRLQPGLDHPATERGPRRRTPNAAGTKSVVVLCLAGVAGAPAQAVTGIEADGLGIFTTKMPFHKIESPMNKGCCPACWARAIALAWKVRNWPELDCWMLCVLFAGNQQHAQGRVRRHLVAIENHRGGVQPWNPTGYAARRSGPYSSRLWWHRDFAGSGLDGFNTRTRGHEVTVLGRSLDRVFTAI